MNPKKRDGRHGPLDGVVRVQALRLYTEFVRELGGDPHGLLAAVQIAPQSLTQLDAFISYRSMVHLLERTAAELECPDFGLRLAARQGGIATLGPLEVAMRNSTTVGEAYRYCAGHMQVYSPVVSIEIEEDREQDRYFMRFEILLDRVPNQRQAVENALGLTHHAVRTLSSGHFGAREVWFMHAALLPLGAYQRYFDAPVRFGMPFNAVFFNRRDFAKAIQDQDPQIYEMASSYIDIKFPAGSPQLGTRVYAIAARLLAEGQCTHAAVAAKLNMHPRTLQRRLREEGASFESIKDDVRRDAAARYLSQSDLPLIRISSLLGYSESSVLTRSCQRWFAKSPRQLREEAGGILELD